MPFFRTGVPSATPRASAKLIFKVRALVGGRVGGYLQAGAFGLVHGVRVHGERGHPRDIPAIPNTA
ncbi:MAG: hypothetical protein ACKO4T_15740, partial [Planctomycetaceae bacterium]